MATGTILDMFAPQTAETVGTMRTERIANEPFEQQIRNAGMSVVDALLSSVRDKVVEIATGTPVGQSILEAAKQKQQEAAMSTWGPVIVLVVLAAVFLLGMSLKRG